MSLEEYFGDWLKVIDIQELNSVVHKVNTLYKTRKCEPSYNNIFKAFNITPYKELCQVWLLQDPYPQSGVSTGVALANKNDKEILSPSLEVVKESIINFEVPHNFITFAPSLEEWSEQGILLLNSALTVETGKPGSHSMIWREFIKKLLINLSRENPGLIYVLWGTSAKTFNMYIDKCNTIYKMPHPAYYARTNSKIPYDFFRTLSKQTKYLFDKSIKWYSEIDLNN